MCFFKIRKQKLLGCSFCFTFIHTDSNSGHSGGPDPHLITSDETGKSIKTINGWYSVMFGAVPLMIIV